MPRVVLDASALLAPVLEEPGAGVVVEALRSGAAMSAVNVAEVASRLHQDGWTGSEVAFVFDNLGIEVLPFDREVALLSGRFHTLTRQLGLGLGDRARLATGRAEGCPVLTADRSWLEIGIVDLDIRSIR